LVKADFTRWGCEFFGVDCLGCIDTQTSQLHAGLAGGAPPLVAPGQPATSHPPDDNPRPDDLTLPYTRRVVGIDADMPRVGLRNLTQR
jgi:hypothetical protein